MASPIKTKNQIDGAPTPQNTPASVLKDSYLKNGNPTLQSQQTSRVPQTIKEEDINAALAKNPQLLATIQEKLGSLLGQDSGYISSLPHKVKDRIHALKKLQKDLFELEKEFQMEMFELENKYLMKYAPLHERRAALVKGVEEPTVEEVKTGKILDKENDSQDFEEDEEEEEEVGVEAPKGIPSFWLTALENLPMVSQTITDRDAEVLDYLSNVWMEYLTEGKPGFKLFFEFDENPFFKDKILTKTYYYQPELGYSGDFIYDHAKGASIQWNSNDDNVTVIVEKRKQRNKSTKQVRTIEKITPVESFFNFFDPPAVPKSDNKTGDILNDEHAHPDEDEDIVTELESRLALDYAIGEEIKDKLIPRAVDWFTGVAREFDYDEDVLADEDSFEEEEEDEDEDEEEDEGEGDSNTLQEESEEDEFANVAKKEQPPECKQS